MIDKQKLNKIPLAQMGVFAPRSAPAWPYAQPPIETWRYQKGIKLY